jgi:integrase
MAFLADAEELKTGLIIFHRTDVKHRNWYCRIKLPKVDRYKVVSLKTSDKNAAREVAFNIESEIRFSVKHDLPIFNHPFSLVAAEYVRTQQERAETGHISKDRALNVESAIRTLNIYVGTRQIHLVGQTDWDRYPIWRRKQERRQKEDKPSKIKLRKGVPLPVRDNKAESKETKTWRVSDWTIRAEMSVFRSIMAYAASRRYVPERNIFKGHLHSADERREEFTREEYRALHTKGRAWKNKATTASSKWYREIVYNFVLIMCNTGMRPPEAKNLRWRDVSISMVRRDTRGRESLSDSSFEAAHSENAGPDSPEQRKVVILHVRGKDKHRSLVAASNVADYLERVRAIAKATGPDDFVFTTFKGKQAESLYASLVRSLLEDTKLLIGPEGTTRSTYCFRHTYATLRLSEGIDVYILAEQMGTSVQMIEQHYGHINPVKNADRILMGMRVWETPEVEPKVADDTARVNAGATKPSTSKSKGKHRAARGEP